LVLVEVHKDFLASPRLAANSSEIREDHFLMFSFFEAGVTKTKCLKFIGFTELIHLIRNNPNDEKIETIRTLRRNGDENYKELKKKLPYITPNCIVLIRSLKGDLFNQNFIQFSQYLYYDLDKGNAEEYKSYFINKYGHLASLICISSSGGGISVMFKVRNEITKENFYDVWSAVRNTVLQDEIQDKIIDDKCKDIARAMFISYDPNIYYNIDNEIEVKLQESIQQNDKKKEKQSKTCEDFNNRLISPFSIISIGKILEKLRTRSITKVANPIVDFKPADYVEVYIPKFIEDGTKHKIYTSMIHALVYLNPSIEKEYIFSFLFYVNNRFAKPKMEKREFIRLFNLVYKGIKDTGKTKVKIEKRFIHFNPLSNLTKAEKINISNMLNGYKRKNESIQKIINAKLEIEKLGQKITQERIAKISGLSSKTVRSHLNSSITDMHELVEMLNNSLPKKENFHDNLVVNTRDIFNTSILAKSST
jgi:hypothetical protein